MRKRKKLVALSTALLLGLGVLSGCGSEPAASNTPEASEEEAPVESEAAAESDETAAKTPDISEEVTLTMYLIGDRPVDNDEVFAKINEKLKAEINATIDLRRVSRPASLHWLCAMRIRQRASTHSCQRNIRSGISAYSMRRTAYRPF